MSNQSVQEYIQAAKARGAIEVSDEVPGQGFQDDEPIQSEQQLGPELAKRVEELEDRVLNLKTSSSADELAHQYHETNSDFSRKQRLPFQAEMEKWLPGKILHMN